MATAHYSPVVHMAHAFFEWIKNESRRGEERPKMLLVAPKRGHRRAESPNGTWSTDSDDTLYSVRDLDRTPLGRLSRRTRYRLVSSGELPALTINGRHYVSKSAVIELLRRRE
jgi:hypothetical protein